MRKLIITVVVAIGAAGCTVQRPLLNPITGEVEMTDFYVMSAPAPPSRSMGPSSVTVRPLYVSPTSGVSVYSLTPH